jgi:hypothetical protein
MRRAALPSWEEAAMPRDEAALAELRQANTRYHDDYERRLALTIVTMLPNDRDEAERVLTYVRAIMDLPVGEPEGEIPAQKDTGPA